MDSADDPNRSKWNKLLERPNNSLFYREKKKIEQILDKNIVLLVPGLGAPTHDSVLTQLIEDEKHAEELSVTLLPFLNYAELVADK